MVLDKKTYANNQMIQAAPGNAVSNSTMLVVEDDTSIHEVVTEYMKDAGFDVLSAYDGDAALAIIEQGTNIDLFILDIMLPAVSGLELLKAIRTCEQYTHTPVIMLTALNDEYTQLESFNNMADDYVTKPFSPRVLVRRVQALLRRTGALADTLTIGAVTVDLEGYEALENGCRLPLTLREYELLKYLMQNRKKVLSRQQLLDAVWGFDYFGDERIVDVHIKNLRKKMHTNLIATVKGVGYKCAPETVE